MLLPSWLLMFFMMVLLLIFSMFVFANSLFFCFVLLLVAVSMLVVLVTNTYIASLTGFMLIIVYAGAMMILIGYICAVSPNLVLEPTTWVIFPLVICYLLLIFAKGQDFVVFSTSDLSLSDFFYSFYGLLTFATLVVMLFVTLLMVTSQYYVSKGPFRSVF